MAYLVIQNDKITPPPKKKDNEHIYIYIVAAVMDSRYNQQAEINVKQKAFLKGTCLPYFASLQNDGFPSWFPFNATNKQRPEPKHTPTHTNHPIFRKS